MLLLVCKRRVRAPTPCAARRFKSTATAAMLPSLIPTQAPLKHPVLADSDSEKALSIIHEMAVSCLENGEMQVAIGGFRAVLDSRRNDEMPVTAPKTLAAMGNLAACLRQAGDFDEAEELAREQTSRATALLGTAHPDTLGATCNLISVLSAAGKHDEAEPLGQQLLKASELILGEKNTTTLIAKSALAQIYLAQGRHEAAEPLMRDDLASSTLVHGARHSDTLVALSNLANVLTAQRKLQEAYPLMRQHVALCREVHGARHPHTLMAIGNLVELLRRQGGAEAEAEPLLREQSEVSARVLGPRHPDTIDAAESLAALLVHQERLSEALAVVRSLHGDSHLWTISLLNKLVQRLCGQGRASEAEEYAKQLVSATERALGKDNSTTHQTYRLLSYVLAQQRKFEDASVVMQDLPAREPPQLH